MSLPRLLFAIAVLIAPAGHAEPPRNLALRSKEAVGGSAWDRVRSLHILSEVRGSGLKGTREEWIDIAHGLFVSTSTLDNRADGFDGRRYWVRDAAGQVWIQDTPDAQQAAANDSYRAALAFWFPARHRAKVETEPPFSKAGDLYDVVRVTPDGGRPFQYRISRRTHRIAEMIDRGGFYTQTETYADWRSYSGLPIPTVVTTEITSEDGRPLETTTETRRKITINSPVPASAFAPPRSRVDFSFSDGRTSASLPFELLNNHIYVRAKLNGHPVTLMFDTGATGLLDSATAAHLGIAPQGTVAQTGVGRGVDRGGYVKVQRVDVGGLVLRDQTFTTQSEAEYSQVEGLHVDGVIGFELPHRVVVKLDYARRSMELISYDGFRPPAGFAHVPIRFLAQIPVVRANINGVSADFAVDSGSRDSLILLDPLAKRREISASRMLRNTVVGWGTGGAARGDVLRAKSFEIAGLTVAAPVTVLMPQGPPVDGNIGGGILRRFDVILDYPHGKIWLRKNRSADESDPYDRAGLWLNKNGPFLSVMDVLPQSPAAEAGIRVGDRVAAIDGMAASSLGLADVRNRLKAEPGTILRLQIRRGANVKEVRLRLTDLI